MSQPSPAPPVAPISRLPESLRALRHRNFRVYFFGQAVSILGSWVQQVAMAWLVYRLTGSSELLGVTAFCALAPQLFVGPLAGAWIDRHDKRRLLIGVEILLTIQAAVLALLTWFGWINPILIVCLSLLLGMLNSVETPLRQSLLRGMVGSRADLGNAVALNASLFNSGRFIGPPIAGLLVGLTSEAFCFLLNAISFGALIFSLIRLEVAATPRATGAVGHVFREGVRYAFESFPIRVVIIALISLNLTASAYAVLLPIFAKVVFGGDARTLGLLWGAAGCGALASTVFLATRRTTGHTTRAVVGGMGVSTVALATFALSSHFVPALFAMAALGFGISVTNVGANSVLQSIAPEHLRGRIISFFTATRFGFDALGGLAAGFVAAHFDAPHTLLGESLLLALATCWILLRRRKLVRAVDESYAANHSH
ncbi:MAG: MFS transporter [Rhodocyclaceae bacterium]|nr:MAG: MFS transporter [Rhodocyclaceae bacterium]